MRIATKLTIALVAVMALGFIGTGAIAHNEAHAAAAINADNPAITITPSSTPPYTYSPAQLNVKTGQPITIKNNDENGGSTRSRRRTTRSASMCLRREA